MRQHHLLRSLHATSSSVLFFLLISLLGTVSRSQNCSCSAPTPAPAAALDPSNPDPSLFPNLKQYQAYRVIQQFKRIITSDPLNITATWVGNRPCDTYRGFYCEAPPDSPATPTVASIDLNGFHLSAPTLSGFLDQFPDLALFHANSNNFSGAVPDLTGLRYLYELDLSNNIHSGPFPAAVLPLANLTFLDLRFNRFFGVVPGGIFGLDVDVLFLNNNFFSQPLPAGLGATPAAYLTLANNGFTGPIPRSIGNASATLREVLFLNNRLCGCLPYEIGLLANATVFDAGINQITGRIPWSFGCLSNMEQLNLADNLLYGEVPEVLCKLASNGGNLANLSLSGNYFTSLGRTCWELVKNMSDAIDVRRNCIWGLPDQRPAAECSRFFWRPKPYCPLLHHLPCSLPKCSLAWSAAPLKTPPAGRSWPNSQAAPRPPAAGYFTHNMLHPQPRHI